LNVFVDTSVWSLALRRDAPTDQPEVARLVTALQSGESVYTTGLIFQELLQGFSGPKFRDQIVDRFSALPLIVPDRQDHIEAATLHNTCRRAGIQVGTIDVLLARLCLRYDLELLTTDQDFVQIADRTPLRVWQPPRPRRR
jgi:hypothetical protein